MVCPTALQNGFDTAQAATVDSYAEYNTAYSKDEWLYDYYGIVVAGEEPQTLNTWAGRDRPNRLVRFIHTGF